MAKTFLGNVPNQEKIPCSKCGRKFTAPLWRNINAAEQPELKKLCLNGSLTKFKCPHCRHIFTLEYSLFYFDPDNKFIVAAVPKPLLHYSDDYFKITFGDFPAYTLDFRKRVVLRMDAFLETARIFEYGLDDRAIQLMKFFIGMDYEDQGKQPPSKILFSGVVTNFDLSSLQFNVSEGKETRILTSSEKDYKFCSRLLATYSHTYREDDWLAVDKYFTNGFLDAALDTRAKEEFAARQTAGAALKKRIIISVPRSQASIGALVNASRIVLFDGFTVTFNLASEVLVEKIKQQEGNLSKILEQLLGFKPDIVFKTMPRKQNSATTKK